MAWYTTGTIAVSGTTVTGTGTNWLDNKQSIGAGQALLIPGSGTVKMYEIASVTSATKLTLKTSPGTIAAGQAYAILSFYTDSIPDFARRLAAQLSYYQSQMDGWQQIMTGSGNVTLTAPDGTSVTISSLSKLTADIAAALPVTTASLSNINTVTASGYYPVAGDATGAPIAASIGELLHISYSSSRFIQEFTTTTQAGTTNTRRWLRFGIASSDTISWLAWAEIYSTNSKPTPADIGALSLTGGVLTGGVETSGAFKVKGVLAATANSNTFNWNAGILDIVNNPGAATSAAKIQLRMVNTENTANLAVFALQNSGVGLAPGGWQTGSDERIKENIQDIDPDTALQAVLKLRHVTFKMRDTPDGNGGWRQGARSAGYLAQDLEEYLPEAVSTASNPKTFDSEGNQTGFPYQCQADDGSILEIEDMKSVDPGKAAAALNGAAIKALHKLIEKQSAIIAELQKRLKAIDGLDA